MKFTVEKGERFVIIEPHVDLLNGQAASKLKEELMLRNTGGQRNIILDLNRVRSVDEDGIRMGLLARRLCQSVDGLFILAGLHADISCFIKSIGLEDCFVTAKDIEQAKDMIFGHEIRMELKGGL